MDLASREGRREQGARIAAAAEAAGLSLAELAQAVGCSRALIYQYVGGQVLAQADRVQAIARCCGQSLSWFYADEATVPASVPAADDTAAVALAERLATLETLAEAQAAPPDFAAARATAVKLVEAAGESGDAARLARAQYRLGAACHALGELDGARAAMLRAIEGFASVGQDANVLAARQTLGAALAGLGERDRALAEFEQVIAGGAPTSEWRGRLGRADVFEALGRGEEALAELARAEASVAAQPAGAARDWAELYVLAATVNVYLLHDDFAAAQTAARRCAPLAEELACVDQHLEAKLNLGYARRHLGAWAEALEAYDDALRLARLTGDRERQAVALACRAELLAVLGRHESARTQAREGLALGLELGSLRAELLSHLALSETCRRAGELQEALFHAQQALTGAAAHSLAKLEVTARLAVAQARRALGEPGAAQLDERRAAAIAERLGARAAEAQAGLGLARADLDRGDREAARQRLDAARQQAEQTGALELRWEALALAAELGADADAACAYLDALQAQRAALLAAGVEEALLEDAARLTQARACLTLGLKAGRRGHVDQWLEAAAWPPLTAEFAAR